MSLVDWSVKEDETSVAPQTVVAQAAPLTFAKVFWAIVLGNICSALVIGLVYGIATAK
jgi:hypothetical protein